MRIGLIILPPPPPLRRTSGEVAKGVIQQQLAAGAPGRVKGMGL